MATRYVIQINNLRFYVNPTGLNIQKGVVVAPLNTQGGVKYQVWYDAPEILTITGDSAGSTAYNELLFLKNNFERTNKVSELFYKTRLYKGFIQNMQIDHNIMGHPNRFSYTITFQLLFGEKFAIEDFALSRSNSGFLENQINKLEDFINKQIDITKVQSTVDNFFRKL